MQLLTLIVLAPLAGFAVNGLLGTRFGGERVGKRFVSVVGCALPAAAFLLALKCFADLMAGAGTPLAEVAYTWTIIAGNPFEIALYFYRLSAVMVLIVTGVGSLIHVYSIGYMGARRRATRASSVPEPVHVLDATLVLGTSAAVLFVGWEGVGSCSYLLIGFWFENASNARAGKKAFIVNRIGDVGDSRHVDPRVEGAAGTSDDARRDRHGERRGCAGYAAPRAERLSSFDAVVRDRSQFTT